MLVSRHLAGMDRIAAYCTFMLQEITTSFLQSSHMYRIWVDMYDKSRSSPYRTIQSKFARLRTTSAAGFAYRHKSRHDVRIRQRASAFQVEVRGLGWCKVT